MQTRKLGYTDLHLTIIGLGTWAFGGGGWAYAWGPQDDADSIAAIHRALDLGINWIDTAAVYGLGHAEEIVARALAGSREKVLIATKCGLVWDRDRTTPYPRLKAPSVRREVEDSLRRLRVEAIDLYQIHWPSPDKDIEEAWGLIADLIKEGKIRYAGVSNFNLEQLKRVQSIHPVASLQPPYSMLERGVEKELLAYCAANNIGVIVYSPMQAGLLTGKFTKERVDSLPEDDWRRKNRHFQEPELSVNLELVKKLLPLAQRHDRTVAQLAIAWVLRRAEVTAAIVGARRPSQIEETTAAADWQISTEDIAAIETLLAEREQQLRQIRKRPD
ncbi:MAG: aldo/keto reductase [candidate division KSB1 bacterium]|nr:aldo/keto reductase [candidate division KSB1 bacterium]MDZ7301813.1 aldo/keto reductase [candidate division KSB1 bacterium]MDZ7314161.1 aldo/keto reductase [candidate division KSB1 bacterium]